ncbi:MAG: carbamoyl-phosphate synthase large subunit [Acidimicrobiia bacterium]|nr:MAG: carbamoyl-phosphate synthase large subunit [Acidimicrobiia bacterium]
MRRTDIESILVIGSGPIVIGQACEFDYSGTQALRVLRRHGYRVSLVNSNPATIMTDPEFADTTYVEPIIPEVVEAILERERSDALLPTLGGQTALNVTLALHDSGVLDRLGVEIIGAPITAIRAAEDRGAFRTLMEEAGLRCPRAEAVRSVEGALATAAEIGYPVMVRPSFTLGGGGTGLAADPRDLARVAHLGLAASPVGEILVEESVLGWKEFELEVMRDRAGNGVIVCSIENLDPMGVHTGDSITVAPAQTLSDRAYQEMRDEALRCLEAVGVETGGSNVQFAVDPETGRRLVIEMNPRVSRSSALASKATGFPIAKIAALLAVGMTLDEIPNDVTGRTPAAFEPALDYVVVKIPRFDFAKFPDSDDVLGTSMRSVGEAMAFGRTFPEALQKALRSLETGLDGLDPRREEATGTADPMAAASTARPDRILAVADALRSGATVGDLAGATGISPWFLDQILQIVEAEVEMAAHGLDAARLRSAKRLGFADRQIARIVGMTDHEVARMRADAGVERTFKTVDTCAAEFEAETPYYYSCFEDEDEAPPPEPGTVVVLGSGPNRIGQGIEFDYCCVHASLALAEAGYRSVMINCNPETVSTDYDVSDRLYFEPLTEEDVLAVVARERPEAVIVQLGGQTPLRLVHALEAAGVSIAGTPADAIDLAEDRQRFSTLCRELGIPQPAHGTATSLVEAEEVADRIGFPVLVRPSYVLGGRGMRVCWSADELTEYLRALYGAPAGSEVDASGAPVAIDRFLEGAVEVDVDALCDGAEVLIGGIMEHVEEAGVHSGDSACVIPPQTLSEEAEKAIRHHTEALALGLGVRGLINVQFAVLGDEALVLEANPRASRTVPFVSKATGVPLARLAARVMMGETLEALRAAGALPDRAQTGFVAVKAPVLPWSRFPDEDVLLGPEMRATGEVMGMGPDAGIAYLRALLGAGIRLPTKGTVFLSLANRDKQAGVAAARALAGLGFRVLATDGTAEHLARQGIAAVHVDKVGEGPWDPVHLIHEGKVDLVINTPRGGRARGDGRLIRAAAQACSIPCITTVRAGVAVANALAAGGITDVKSLQERAHAEPDGC